MKHASMAALSSCPVNPFMNPALHDLAVVLGSEVSDEFANIGLEGVVVHEACFHGGLVVVSGESVHESSKVVSNDGGVEGEVTAVFVTDHGIELFSSWEWESELGNSRGFLGGSIVVVVVIIILKKVDISHKS